MRRTALAVGLVVLVSLAGCSALTGGDGSDPGQATIEDNEANATNVTQSLRIEANESVAGSEWTEIGATYPRDEFTVDAAQHADIELGVDTNGDGEMDREFNETHVSGVNNNAYSFTIGLDTDYTLEAGDVVMVSYPDIDNPSEPGTYEVEVRLNDQQTATTNVTIE
ncbi:hypothetical protein [Halorientalis salina]|uniref:hypothetical protein n=1 Tax=Halorientalis salina TaxID=2932266 RepID=UPI0010AD2EF2|nr:hypothetical protein [Halorientalis salina]